MVLWSLQKIQPVNYKIRNLWNPVFCKQWEDGGRGEKEGGRGVKMAWCTVHTQTHTEREEGAANNQSGQSRGEEANKTEARAESFGLLKPLRLDRTPEERDRLQKTGWENGPGHTTSPTAKSVEYG